MRDDLRDQLAKEITRKQFLQYMAGAVLTIFGFGNLINLLTGGKHAHHLLGGTVDNNRHGFGSSKFGV